MTIASQVCVNCGTPLATHGTACSPASNPLRPGFAYVELGVHNTALDRVRALEEAIRALEFRDFGDYMGIDHADYWKLKELVPDA